VSVRKRVIKILKELCVVQPGFSQFSQACRIILNRLDILGEEESTKVTHVYYLPTTYYRIYTATQQLIVGAFRELWFSPGDQEAISRRVTAITSVVSSVSYTLLSVTT